ncbi:MAG TPA: TonB-dependent receptor [Longimicrobiales bacterium]
MRWASALLLLLGLSLPPVVWAQGGAGRITGVVTDDGGQPLSGASVVVEGTQLGALTDSNGRFLIAGVPSGTYRVTVSLLGYETRTVEGVVVTAGQDATLNVQLQTTAIALEEIVAVGYGAQRREIITGSVASVSGDAVAVSPSPNIAASLAGRLPGLTINQRTGEPGREQLNILVRGRGTFRDNAPLIIIDGVERSLMERLDPEDIESITVLKDASAAIYGARAANGVILITTKKGAAGRARFELTYDVGFSRPTRLPEMLDAATFAEVYNEADWYRQGRPAEYTPFYTAEAIQKFRDGSDPVLYPNTNWVKEVLKPYTVQHKFSLRASGGTEAVQYLLSFGALDQPGHFRNNPTAYRQYNARTRVDANLSEHLSVSANLYAILNNRTYSPVSTDVNFINILQANPTIVARYPNGLIGPGRLGENPLLLDQRGSNVVRDNPLYSTFTATYRVPFLEGLRLDATYNYDLSHQFEKTFIKPYYYHEYNPSTGEYELKQGTGSSTVELTDTYRRWTTQLYNIRATYETIINEDHTFSLMLGSERQTNTFSFASAYRKNFVSPAIPQISVGSSNPEDKDNSGSASRRAYDNYFGRLNYDFRAKYLFQFQFRYDGSSTFAPGKRYGFFPGFSAGWRLSQEGFVRDNLPFVNELKLRVSYGQVGNDRVGQYQYLQAFSFGGNYVFGTSDAPGIYANTLPNPNITWEVSKKTDVGLEANLWQGLLGFDLTLWQEKRSNILAQPNLSVSRVFGFPALPDQNIGKVDNHGFELAVSHENTITPDWSYSILGNLAFARSKIVFMDEVPQPEPYQNQTGRPVGAGLYYKADGIFRTQEELDSYPHGAGAEVGDIRVVDLNGDGVIDSRDMFRVDCSSVPEYVAGLTLGTRYKSLDLNLFFQGQTGACIYDGTASVLGGTDFANATVYRAANRWRPDNPNGTMPRAGAWQPGPTTFFLYDATFARLKTAELGFTLPTSVASRFGMNSVRLYLTGFNLLTWAKELKWADPELVGDFTQYPPLRIINMGVSVSF